MKTAGSKDLGNDPGLISKCSKRGENVVITNRGKPVAITIPFDKSLLELGLQVDLAVKLFADKTVGLTKAAKIAGMSTERFLEAIEHLEIDVVDMAEDELMDELESLEVRTTTKRAQNLAKPYCS